MKHWRQWHGSWKSTKNSNGVPALVELATKAEAQELLATTPGMPTPRIILRIFDGRDFDDVKPWRITPQTRVSWHCWPRAPATWYVWSVRGQLTCQ